MARTVRPRGFSSGSYAFKLLALTVLLISVIAEASAEDPNFVMILLDDMSWVGSSVQMDPDIPDSKSDYHITPNLDILASQGMVFSDAYSCGPMCSATRAAIFTGKSSAQMNVTDVRNASQFDDTRFQTLYTGHPLSPPVPRGAFFNETTLAEALKQANSNYRAGYFGKSDWWPNPLTDGYDAYKTEHANRIPAEVDPHGMYTITSEANSFMQQQVQANRPFFVTLGHYAVKTGLGYFPETYEYFNDIPPGIKHHDQAYAAMHLEVDKTIGLVMDQITSLGIEDNTYVIFTSDNGAATGITDFELVNSPLYGGKGTIWEGGSRAPLIIRGPGIAAGSYSDVPVNSIDFLPTLVDLAGGTGPLPAGVEGTSLKPVLENGGQLPAGQTALSRPWAPNGELLFHYPHYGPDIPIGSSTPASAIRDGDYKLVRIYGENGAPNSFLLFNLADNIEESNDPSSPLNLAPLMPEKVAQMDAKLENWLQGVGASLPYDVRDPMTLTWRAETNWLSNPPGSVTDMWKTVNDVDSYENEHWQTLAYTDETVPHLADAPSYQPRLSKQAFVFDGNDGLYHQFFRVSDPRSVAIDGDNSATIQAWVRFDDLNSEQLLFESGANNRGLSLTLGDANGDSIKDELRLRVVGNSVSNSLTLTTEIDKFADPTQDFLHIAAVISDQTGNRYLELYINGALAARIDGGGTPLDWDSYYQASLGAISPSSGSIGYSFRADSLGGSAGAGELPFTGGNLRGELAEFEFRNFALSANEIRDQYNSFLDCVDAGVRLVSGETAVLGFRPSNVSLHATQSSSLLVIEERHDTLADNLTVNSLVTGPLTLDRDDQGMSATLTAGTEFTSYLLHFDPASNNGSTMESLVGSVQFDEKIIGVVWDQTLLSLSDAELGSIGNYGLADDRGLFWAADDFLNISPDQLTLNFGLTVPGDELLQFRVLTEKMTFLAADFNFDGNVDSEDCSVWQESFGIDAGGDADGDGDTDGRDFLVWQRQYALASASLVNSADFNLDGFVDDRDLSIWQAGFGIDERGDADGDGDTDGRDFLAWQRQYAPTSASLAAHGSLVPEPNGLLMCLLAGMTCALASLPR